MQKLSTCIIHKKFSVFMNGAQNVGCMLVNPDIDAVGFKEHFKLQ